MNIVIRADASVHIGSGHVMRCLVLAKALQANGHQVGFITRPQQGDMVDFITQQHIKLIALPSPLTPLIPTSNADYAAWLQVSELDDAENTIALIDENIDLMIVDHYGINHAWQEQVKTQLQCSIMAIDDLVRPHSADIILDQTFSRKAEDYISVAKISSEITSLAITDPDITNAEVTSSALTNVGITNSATTNILTGCQFALLAPRFAELRGQAFCKQLHAGKMKVLISMGGIDNPNASLKVLLSLESLTAKPLVTLLLSQRSPHFEQVNAFCQSRSAWITHIEFTHSMPELMLEHDLSIGAPGSTSWERACLGLPSIVIPLAENQQQICTVLESVGAVLRVELERIDSELLPAYQHILANWVKFQQVNLSLCDGLGSQRVVQCIEQRHHQCIEQRHQSIAMNKS